MRSLNLLKLALDAETLRLRALAARQGRRAAFGTIALVFALAVLALAEIAGWQGLRLKVEAIPATLILLAINLAGGAAGTPAGVGCRTRFAPRHRGRAGCNHAARLPPP